MKTSLKILLGLALAGLSAGECPVLPLPPDVLATMEQGCTQRNPAEPCVHEVTITPSGITVTCGPRR
jgi:hypothetical protein